MPTVTHKNQPGIHTSHGMVPLAGTRHVYTVHKILWPEEVEGYIQTILIPRSLHVCCGKSKLGDIRTDLYETNIDIRCDAAKLPFSDGSFESVLCDPPYNGNFQWNHDLLSEL